MEGLKLYHITYMVSPYQQEDQYVVAKSMSDAIDELIKRYPDSGRTLDQVLNAQQISRRVVVQS